MTDQPSQDSLTVLCIEDEPSMIDLVKIILNRRGYHVLGALGGAEGLEMARQQTPDLILLDLMMPDMDGWEVYHRLRADEAISNTPIVVVSAKASHIDQVLGLKVAGVQGYVTKPFSPSELVSRIEQVMAERLPGGGADQAAAE